MRGRSSLVLGPFVRRSEGLFVFNLDFQKAGDRESNADRQFRSLPEALQNGSDFLNEFCHENLLLVMGNDAAQVTHRGERLHTSGRNTVEKGGIPLARQLQWPSSRCKGY